MFIIIIMQHCNREIALCVDMLVLTTPHSSQRHVLAREALLAPRRPTNHVLRLHRHSTLFANSPRLPTSHPTIARHQNLPSLPVLPDHNHRQHHHHGPHCDTASTPRGNFTPTSPRPAPRRSRGNAHPQWARGQD